MFTIESREDTKTFVSALRKALKARNVTLSYNQVLDAVALAMGYSGAEELSARLPARPAMTRATELAELAKYPLVNTGQFDFCVTGALLHGVSLASVRGTLEDIFASVAYASSGTRSTAGEVDPEFEGSTEVNWDGQRTRRTAGGKQIFLLEDSDVEVSSDRLILVPASVSAVTSAFEDPQQSELPARAPLVDAYVQLFSGTLLLRPSPDDFEAVSTVCGDAAAMLGFRMTAREVQVFCERMNRYRA